LFVVLTSVIAYAVLVVQWNAPGTTTTGPKRVSYIVRVTGTVPVGNITWTVTVCGVIFSDWPSNRYAVGSPGTSRSRCQTNRRGGRQRVAPGQRRVVPDLHDRVADERRALHVVHTADAQVHPVEPLRPGWQPRQSSGSAVAARTTTTRTWPQRHWRCDWLSAAI